jgi:hypothetical protein
VDSEVTSQVRVDDLIYNKSVVLESLMWYYRIEIFFARSYGIEIFHP